MTPLHYSGGGVHTPQEGNCLQKALETHHTALTYYTTLLLKNTTNTHHLFSIATMSSFFGSSSPTANCTSRPLVAAAQRKAHVRNRVSTELPVWAFSCETAISRLLSFLPRLKSMPCWFDRAVGTVLLLVKLDRFTTRLCSLGVARQEKNRHFFFKTCPSFCPCARPSGPATNFSLCSAQLISSPTYSLTH